MQGRVQSTPLAFAFDGWRERPCGISASGKVDNSIFVC